MKENVCLETGLISLRSFHEIGPGFALFHLCVRVLYGGVDKSDVKLCLLFGRLVSSRLTAISETTPY